ncbi:MAG TPA: hypothetical protein DD638_03390, partial [Pasteurellaceae bacterium]|nr:hypothetical protein [Pasteurellaceae bacterium]
FFDINSIFFATVLTLGATIWGAILLRNWFFRDKPTLEHNWAVQLMFAFLAVLVTILFVAFTILTSGIEGN